MHISRLISLGFVFLGLVTSVNAETIIHHNDISSAKDALVFDILKLAVLEADPHAKFVVATEKVPSGRLAEELLSGGLSVLWGSSSAARESQFRAVRLPVLKGLLGHRVFIIHKDNQHLFSNIRTLNDLKKLSAGLGRTWGDTQIMKDEGLPVVTASGFINLIHMLDGKRFDYFPRGVHEPWSEVKNSSELEVTVEKDLMLIYPLAMHFYVAPANKELHDLIYKGLETILLNGKYDDLFFDSEMVKDALGKANIANRHIIRMSNPNIPPDTPLDREEFWLKLDAVAFQPAR